MFLLAGKLHTGTAAVAEFLLIAGGAETALTGVPVISWCTGIGDFVFLLFTFVCHEYHAPFTHYRTEKRKIQENIKINNLFSDKNVR